MAKPKKPSMLSRQRQLRQQQQQVRNASSNQLPPRGGSSGGNGGAVTRRGNSTPATRGGALARTGASKPTDGRVQPVRVRDVTNTTRPQVSGSGNPPRVPGPRPVLNTSAAKGLLKGAASGVANKAGLVGMAVATADQARRVFNPKDNIVTSLRDLGNTLSNSGRPGPGHSRYQAPKPAEKQGPPAPRPEQIAKYRAERDVRHMGQRAALQRDFPTTRNSGSNSSGGSGSSGGGGSRQSSSSSGSAPKPRFSGSVADGRRIWAEKYSSDKYKGQAIHKEATKALEQMKNNESGQRAKNIGSSGASPATNFETKTKIDSSKVPDFKKIKGRQFGK